MTTFSQAAKQITSAHIKTVNQSGALALALFANGADTCAKSAALCGLPKKDENNPVYNWIKGTLWRDYIKALTAVKESGALLKLCEEVKTAIKQPNPTANQLADAVLNLTMVKQANPQTKADWSAFFSDFVGVKVEVSNGGKKDQTPKAPTAKASGKNSPDNASPTNAKVNAKMEQAITKAATANKTIAQRVQALGLTAKQSKAVSELIAELLNEQRADIKAELTSH